MATEIVRDPSAAVPSTGIRVASVLLGGQLAALLMAVVMMVVSVAFLGETVLFPVQLVASILLGHDALTHAGPGVLATGLLFHQLGPALLWSLVYLAMVFAIRERLDLNRALMVGFLIGLASMVVDVYFVGPPLQQVTSGENLWMKYLPRPWDWASHMLFGLSLGFFHWAIRNALEKRRGLVRRIHVPTTVTADDSGVKRVTDGRAKRINE